MQCPVCEAENPEDSVDCVTCGRALASGLAGVDAAPVDGLQPTSLVSSDLAVDVEPLPGLEQTQVEADPQAPQQWTAGPLALEQTAHDSVDGAASSWTSEIEVDRGREAEAGERTAAPPESATCPWCGATALEAICGACGRRKSRYTSPAAQAPRAPSAGETVSCPSCFARVLKDVRCSDCGVPFPLQEL